MRREKGSPWILEMDNGLRFPALDHDLEVDVVIVGGGIAGMSTAYYLAERSDLRVALLERDRIGQGSSGRNAGQGLAVMERSFADLLNDYEGGQIADILNELESGHMLLRELCREVDHRPEPIESVVWTGLSGIDEITDALIELELRQRFKAPIHSLVLAEEVAGRLRIHHSIKDLVSTENARWLQNVLHTKDDYLAAFASHVSLVNSGKLCQSIARYLLRKHLGRIDIFEGSTVERIDGGPGLKVWLREHTVSARAVVLCTNGYPVPLMSSGTRPKITTSLKQYLASMVAYEPADRQNPGAYIYYHQEGDPREEPYFYFTRRPFDVTGKDLVAVGGPQVQTVGDLDPEVELPDGVYGRIDDFVERSYLDSLRNDKARCWNGLMGYTSDGLRLVGPDHEVEGLWYNIGCNGVGLLPSLVGGRKVAKQLDDGLRSL
jgi:glycine/D-amino acid oxidase-like deaminating enzyme